MNIITLYQINPHTFVHYADYDDFDFIEFDVAIETTKKGGVGISNVISGNLENKAINRIKFRVPVCMGMKQYNNKKK